MHCHHPASIRRRHLRSRHLRFLKLGLCCLVFCALIPSTGPALAQPTAGLVGHWELNGDASDGSPSNQNGVFVGSPWTMPGPSGDALGFDGDDYVRVEDDGPSPLDLTAAITVAAWINPSSIDGTNQKLVAKDNVFELEIGHGGADRYSVRLANLRRGRGDTALVEGVWQHLAITWDGTTVRYYLDGQADGTASYIGSLPQNDRDLGLGARPGGYLKGALDDVRVYDRALSAAEVVQLSSTGGPDLAPPLLSLAQPTGELALGTTTTELSVDTDELADCRFADTPGIAFADMTETMVADASNHHEATVTGLSEQMDLRYFVRCRDAAGNTNQEDYEIAFSVGPASDLVAYWPFNEGTGILTADESPYGNDAHFRGTPLWADGFEGPGIDFGGELLPACLEVFDPGTDSVLDLSTQLTVSAWVKPSMVAGERRIISKDNVFEFEIGHVNDGLYSLRLNNSAIGHGSTEVLFERWQHLSATWDGTTVRYYYNGQLDGSFPFSGPLTQNELSVALGARTGGAWQGGGYYEGALDEIRLYRRALSDTEVRSVYLGAQSAVPEIELLEPDGIDDSFIATCRDFPLMRISWIARDPDSDAQISLYYTQTPTDSGGTLIEDGISEDDNPGFIFWDVSSLPRGGYYVYAVIDDGVNPPQTAISLGSVDVGFNVIITEMPDVEDILAGLEVTFRGRHQPYRLRAVD